MSDATLSPRELSLKSNTDVQGHIQAENARVDAQAKAEGWTFWTLAAESLADEYDNVYDYEREMAWSTYSDMHKEEYGFRPRRDFSSWTLETFEEAIRAL